MKTITVEITTPDEIDPLDWLHDMIDEQWYARRHSISEQVFDNIHYEVTEER